MNAALWLGIPPVLWAAYTWGSYAIRRGSIWRGRRSGRLAALTFDDGPDREWTPRVLDILARERVTATFFLIGRRAAAAPDVTRRIVEDGHELGNHTWSHRSLWLCGPQETEREIVQGHDAIARAAGTAPRYFRAPWGLTNLAVFPVLRRLATPCVFWTVQTEGQRAAGPERQLRIAAERVKPGAIFDLHDADGVRGAGDRTVQMLPGLIGALRQEGYTLAGLGDLL
ncbi:MAG TPA: polysaccharide deacetylase family protein [Candidatus Methylomirabilis sp.]|nr:polysaccharide deacetylase family protein [Candidatus Methylomirabilis sp.]